MKLGTLPNTLIAPISAPAAPASHQIGSFLGAGLGGLVFDLTGAYSLLWEATVIAGLVAAMLHFPIDDTTVKFDFNTPNSSFLQATSTTNLAIIDPKSGEATKIGWKELGDGRRVRFAKKSGEVIDV